MKKKPVERNQRRLQPTFRGEREGSDRRWQRMSWRRSVKERTLGFEVQPLLPFLLPGHALVAIFSSATTWSRSGFFCF